MTKRMNSLFGFILCMGLVSFAPKSLLLVDDGRAPASNGDGQTTISRTESTRPQLFVFGPLIIYKRTQKIEEVRTEYRRLQTDVDKIEAQKAEIERLLARESALSSEANQLRQQFTELVSEHTAARTRIEQLQEEFAQEQAAMQAEITALQASNHATEEEKREALALLEAERANALTLSTEIDGLKDKLDSTQTELADTKTKLEEAKADAIAKEEELQRVRCENEDAIASLKDDIKKIEKERDEIAGTVQRYEDNLQILNQQNQMMMMAMAQFSMQALLSPQQNPYLMQSSLFDPNFQMMHMQQAMLVNQMNRQQYLPQVVNNYYGNHSFIYGSGGDFLTNNPYENNHQGFSMFADTNNLNSSRLPSSQAPNGFYSF